MRPRSGEYPLCISTTWGGFSVTLACYESKTSTSRQFPADMLDFCFMCPLTPWVVTWYSLLTVKEITNYPCKTIKRISRTDGIWVGFFYRMNCNQLYGEGQEDFSVIEEKSAKSGYFPVQTLLRARSVISHLLESWC
jgi:hypothetical protein